MSFCFTSNSICWTAENEKIKNKKRAYLLNCTQIISYMQIVARKDFNFNLNAYNTTTQYNNAKQCCLHMNRSPICYPVSTYKLLLKHSCFPTAGSNYCLYGEALIQFCLKSWIQVNVKQAAIKHYKHCEPLNNRWTWRLSVGD